MNEFETKQTAILDLLERQALEALLLRRVSSFAWATGGSASYINTAASEGVASLLITASHRYLIADNIEAPRLEQEEGLKEQGWEFEISPWYEAANAIQRLASGLKVGADVPFPGTTDLSGPVAGLRSRLTPEEGERFKSLGRLCAESMDSAVQSVKPGMSEYQIAALLSKETESRGVQTIVNLIATDERIHTFRHPLPTQKTLDRYAMLVLCGRQNGLVCSMTRLVSFGRLPEELRRKAEAVAQVDAAFILGTRSGRSLGAIFQEAVETYAKSGYPGEWQLHHQGGSAGYEPREHIASPGSDEVVYLGQAYAWNPSITGTKSEDTILVGTDVNEVLTRIEGWPELEVVQAGKTMTRPAILEVD
jgi:Xaa-Pro aminopeptidase